jgi:hypothetical protein
MKKRVALAGIALIMSITAVPCMGQERLSLVFGPRVGMMYVFADWDGFNTSLQQIFPDEGRAYVPFLTHFGASFEQRVSLGTTTSHFAFQEIFTIAGMDQNVVMPSLNVLIGFRSRAGLEFGLGPNFALAMGENNIQMAVTVVYAIGWTFSFSGVYVPVDLAFVPTPKDGNFRISLLTGFNFDI